MNGFTTDYRKHHFPFTFQTFLRAHDVLYQYDYTIKTRIHIRLYGFIQRGHEVPTAMIRQVPLTDQYSPTWRASQQYTRAHYEPLHGPSRRHLVSRTVVVKRLFHIVDAYRRTACVCSKTRRQSSGVRINCDIRSRGTGTSPSVVRESPAGFRGNAGTAAPSLSCE